MKSSPGLAPGDDVLGMAMSYVSETWRDYQRQRFMRPDAKRYRKPKAASYVFGSKQFYDVLYGRKYRADQLRHPAGSSEGGGRFAPEGGASSGGSGAPKVRLAFAGPAAAAARATVQLGLMLYTYMSAQNGPGKRAVVEFKAREFSAENGQLDLSNVRLLDREETERVCPRLPEVQERLDRAVETVKGSGVRLTPQQFGTAVHTDLKKQIDALFDPNLVAERSLIKTREEVGYGAKGSIRVDALERVDRPTACVHDIKTGDSGMSLPRMREMAESVAVNFREVTRIVVTEVRPAQ